MIKDKHQYHICGWMINQLHLEGKELQCYAIIYSLSQLGEGRYIAGLNFLAEFMQCSQPSASAAIRSLFEKKLIKKDEVVTEYGRRVFYYCSDEGGEKENDEGVHKNFMDGVHKNFMPKYNNKEYNENKKIRLSNDNQKKEYSDDFLEFWKAYGYSKDKGGTYKKWKKLSEKDKKAALEALPAYFADCEIHTREKRYPSVYLNKRTWEDDFTSPEEKEETIADARAPMDVEQWERNQRWMEENTPKYVGKISFDDFISMRGEVMLNSRIYGDILKEMHQSGYEGDIVAEFKRRNDERICSHG